MRDALTRAQFMDRLQERSEHFNDLVRAGMFEFLREQGEDIPQEEEVSSRLILQALGPEEGAQDNPVIKYMRAAMRIFLQAALDAAYGPDE